jgi:hypothetical protein
MKIRKIRGFRLARRLRMPLDLALANEPERQNGAREADDAGDGEHAVEPGDESLRGGVCGQPPRRGRQLPEEADSTSWRLPPGARGR